MRFPDGTTIQVELALTPQQRWRGLMGRRSIDKDGGMLFVFPEQRWLEFWMKDTWISLDMVFLDKDRRVTAIFERVPRAYPDTPESKLARRSAVGQYVLELPAGAAKRRGLKVGQSLRLEVMIPTI